MKASFLLRKSSASLLICLAGIVSSFSQVGIGTINPNEDAALDITSNPQSPGGLLLPRLELTGENNPHPLTQHVEGMTVYNTNTINDVTAGFYYNDGAKWIKIGGAIPNNDKWSLQGNARTDPDTNFIGTTDNQTLRIRTNNIARLEINGENGQVRSFNFGTSDRPTYSWIGGDDNTGIYSPLYRNIGFSTNGTEKLRIPNANQVHAMQSGTHELPFYSWANDTGTGIFRQSENTLGFSSGGSEKFRMNSDGQLLAVDWVSAANSNTPSYSWALFPRTGMSITANNSIGLITNGTERLRIPNRNQIFAMNAGTAAAPFYSWESHRGNGMYKPGNNQLGFSTDGAERVRINHNGNVGIGTEAPTQRLHVEGNIRLQGALMPNNQAGASRRLLQSNGANTAPTWGPRIRTYISTPVLLEKNKQTIITFPAETSTRYSVYVSMVQPERYGPREFPRVTTDYTQIQDNGQFIMSVTNLTGGGFFGWGGEDYTRQFKVTIIDWH